MKRLLALFITMVMVVALFAACTPTPADESTQTEEPSTVVDNEETDQTTAETDTVEVAKLIYVIIPTKENPGLKAEGDAAEDEAKKLGYEVKYVVHNDDPLLLANIIDNAISDKAAAIVCDNAGADASIASIQKALDAGIPSFLIDREINATGIAKAQIVSNNFQGASLVGEYFVQLMGEKGNYVELVGIESDNNAQIRSQGYHSFIDKFPDMVCISQQSANWSETEAFEKIEIILQSGEKIDGVICGNDSMGIGAQKALLDAGLDDVIVCSFDGFNDVRDSILRDEIDATAMQPLTGSARFAVQLADKYLKEGSTGQDEKILMDCVLITKDNADKLDNFSISE